MMALSLFMLVHLKNLKHINALGQEYAKVDLRSIWKVIKQLSILM